jgi:recombination protein RecT
VSEVAVRTPVDVIAGDEFKTKLAEALPPGLDVDRFTRTALMAVQQNPDLQNHDQKSLYLSIMQCAKDGLLPDGREAALILFNDKKAGTKKVQYIPMIGGLRKIAAEHGVALASYIVREKDTFDYQLGFEPSIRHQPPKLGDERGEIIGVYAAAIDSLGQRYLEVLTVAEVQKVRNVSRAKDRGPWVDWYDEMARKTAARRLFKQLALPDLSERAASVLAANDAEYDLGPTEVERALETALPADEDAPDDTTDAFDIPDSVIDAALALPETTPVVLVSFDQKGQYTQLVKECAKLNGETVAKIKKAHPLTDDMTAAAADVLIARFVTWKENLEKAKAAA